MKPRFRAEWVVVREELLILASCLLRPMSRYRLLIIQPMWQPRTYFFNHYIVLFSMNLHSPSKSNTNSTQILVFILICLYFTTGHFHTYFAKNAAYIIIPFNSWFSFQQLCRLLWGCLQPRLKNCNWVTIENSFRSWVPDSQCRAAKSAFRECRRRERLFYVWRGSQTPYLRICRVL